MQIVATQIPHIYRNKYLRNGSTSTTKTSNGFAGSSEVYTSSEFEHIDEINLARMLLDLNQRLMSTENELFLRDKANSIWRGEEIEHLFKLIKENKPNLISGAAWHYAWGN